MTSVTGGGKEGRNCPGASNKGFQSATGTGYSVLTIKMENIFCVSRFFSGVFGEPSVRHLLKSYFRKNMVKIEEHSNVT